MTTACCTLGAHTPFSSHLPLPGVPEAAPALSLLLHSILAAYTTAVEPVVATPLGLHVHHSLPGVLRAESRVGSFHNYGCLIHAVVVLPSPLSATVLQGYPGCNYRIFAQTQKQN